MRASTGFGAQHRRKKRRRPGQPSYRLTNYADDFAITVHSDRADARDLRDQIAQTLAPMGLMAAGDLVAAPQTPA